MTPPSRHRRAAPLAAGGAALGLVLGAGALAAGVALLPHLTRGGVSGVAVLGLVLVVGGVVALGAAARAVWRWQGRLGRGLLVPGVVVLVALALLTLGQAVAATTVPPTAVEARPDSVGLRHEDVRARTADGVELAGWYVPSTNGAAVVLLHGAGSTRSSVLGHAKVLSGHGYGVLLLDARGHGDSGGRAMDFGWNGDSDVRAAIDVLLRRPDVTGGRVAVVGLSMGGEEAIGALGADGRIRAVVAEGATHRVADDRAWLVEAYGVRGWVQLQLDRLTYALTDLLTAASPPPALRDAVARATPRPVLLIAASERPDESAAAASIEAVARDAVEVWVAPGGHTRALGAAPAEWSRRVDAFLSAALAP